MSMSSKTLLTYSDMYIEKVFYVWYSHGRPSRLPSDFPEFIPEDEHNRKPKIALISKWKDERNWDLRADELDAKAMQIADDEVIMQKAQMLKRQAEIGLELQEMGMNALRAADKFDSSSAAVNAVVKGVEIERSSRGISEFLMKLSKMSDADIKDELTRLALREDNTILDAEEVADKINNTEASDDPESKEIESFSSA